jgi:hypothetical protein
VADFTILEKMEEGKKNENNMAWRPQLLANSINSATVYECLFLRLGQIVSALMLFVFTYGANSQCSDVVCFYVWGK